MTSLLRYAIMVAAVALFIAPSPATANYDVDVPISVEWRIHQPVPSACASWGIASWESQPDAIAWNLTLAHNGEQTVKQLASPFSDEAFVKYGWTPEAGRHWYGFSYSGGAHLGGAPVSCDDNQAKQQAAYGAITLRVTMEGPSCSQLTNRATRLRHRMQSARRGNLQARHRLAAAKKQVEVANERLEEARQDESEAAIERALEAKRRADERRQINLEAVRNTNKHWRNVRAILHDTSNAIREHPYCPATP